MAQSTASRLRALFVGDRFAFALGAKGLRLDAEHTSGDELRARAGSPCDLGLGWVSAAGPLMFVGATLSRASLERIAQTVREQVQQWAGYRALVGCTVVAVSPSGEVRERHADPGLWEGLRPAGIPGTLLGAERTLAKMKPGSPYVYWMADRVPGGRPHVLLDALARDPEGTLVASWAARLRAEDATEAWGVARRTEAGSLLLLTSGPVDRARRIVDDVCTELVADHPGLEPLAVARLIRLDAGRVSEVSLSASP